jgi:glutamate--cysteine ligase
MAAVVGGRSMRDLAREVLTLSQAGLRARAATGTPDETGFLAPLWQTVETGQAQADRWLARGAADLPGLLDAARLC